ncbi:MAG: EthD family reductase [Nitriliruptorales bacterium]|nr:EthD family reductase [Nitriliruptorales bacterium]
MIRLTVIYPAADGERFDWDYYLSNHVELVEDKFGKWLKRAEVGKGVAGVPKGDATYTCVTNLYFDSRDDMMAAFKNAGMAIPEDIPNFTDITPIQQVEELLVG